MNSRSATLVAAALVLCALPTGVAAHQMNTSYLDLHVGDNGVLTAKVSFDENDLLVAFELDQNGDGILRKQKMLAGEAGIGTYLERALVIRSDGEKLSLTAQEGRLRLDDKGNLFLDLPLQGSIGGSPAAIDVRFDLFDRVEADHRCLVKVRIDGLEQTQAGVLTSKTPGRAFRLRDPGLLDHVTEFTILGIEHIFLGYDHIMFLLALTVIGGRLVGLIKVVSAFTVAHSITLILASLDVVSLPSRLIESGIAFSIAYVAAENLWRARVDQRWMLTFFFGLVHGFGFANVLRELGLPTRSQELVASLLAFNVGVELGQVAIVAILFPLILWVGRGPYRRPFISVVSVAVLLFGLGWLVERVFDLSYMPL